MSSSRLRLRLIATSLTLLPFLTVRADDPKPIPRPVSTGDAIVVCGQKFSTGAPVVLWTDPGGYDAYQTKPRFGASKGGPEDGSKRYGSRTKGQSPELVKKVEEKGWDLPTLQGVVDQFVIHYDVCGTSRRCFQVLQDARGLSVHFMLDLDGTIYQTLDLQESAWHATKSNSRSVGIEIANMGAYGNGESSPLAKWYQKQPDGQVAIVIPDAIGKDSQRDANAVLRPSRPEPVTGTIHGHSLTQYDLTPQQYESLTKLVATLNRALPKITIDAPRGADGKVLDRVLNDDEWKAYQGILGHYHVQLNKTDPGPAFQWDRVIEGARKVGKP